MASRVLECVNCNSIFQHSTIEEGLARELLSAGQAGFSRRRTIHELPAVRPQRHVASLRSAVSAVTQDADMWLRETARTWLGEN
jgi:hypothetical protein